MTNAEQATFYIGAALARDLDSEEADLILAAEGLDVETNTAAECTAAINKNCRMTPAGPVYDWEDITARAKERGGL